MAERKPISKKTRFEVFKMDSFTCQYCGAKAPDVILEVDHIVPVASGGDDSLLNLITSCRNCNRGKGARKLSDTSAVERQRKQLDDMNAMREQMEFMIEWKQELMDLREEQIDAIDRLFFSIRGCYLTEALHKDIHSLIVRFGFDEVYEAVEIAATNRNYQTKYDVIAKVGGVCYNLRKRRESGDA